MVLINDFSRPLLSEAAASYRKQITEIKPDATLERVFICWLLPDSSPPSASFTDLIQTAAKATGANRTPRGIATLGFAAAIKDNTSEVSTALQEGLRWLSERPAFAPNTTPSFEIDGLALLGIALGAASLQVPHRKKTFDWLAGFLPRSAAAKVGHTNRYLISATANVIGQSSLAPFPSTHEAAIAQIGLATRGAASAPSDVQLALPLQEFSVASEQSQDTVLSAIKLSALHYLFQCLPTVDFRALGLEDVLAVLSRLQHALKRWPWEISPRTVKKDAKLVKWDIDNEYHLQSLLWAVLSPVFPDLDDEENVKSTGHARPRADLCIPSLQLVVEAKFVRDGTQSEFSRITNELAADAGLYCVPGSGFTKIIPVIWDNSSSTDHHAELIQGLEKLPNVTKAIVIPRPGRMKQGKATIRTTARSRKKPTKKKSKSGSGKSRR
ncbi:MAG: hypothetical protein AAB425_09505 [Bdellovibrionota bacterium]